ncbi:MAG: phosphatase PAP2 family protein, partial [Spirochaetales bacterium]
MFFDNSVYEWGLHCIHFVQESKNSFLTVIMLGISFLSDPIAYGIFLPLFFWCINEKKALSLGLLIFFSTSINTSIKNFLQVPRPYISDPSVGLTSEHSFSTPSGHAQISATFWPYAAYLSAKGIYFSKKNKKIKKSYNPKQAITIALAVGMPILIGFSRVYLGVHYPSDVILGWAIGFSLSLGLILFAPKLIALFANVPKSLKTASLAVISFLLNHIGASDTSMSGLFFGFGTGYVFLSEKHGFDAKSGTLRKKILRYFLGLAILALVYVGLSLIFPGEENVNYQLFRFLKYAIIGFFASFTIPKIFIALHLA